FCFSYDALSDVSRDVFSSPCLLLWLGQNRSPDPRFPPHCYGCCSYDLVPSSWQGKKRKPKLSSKQLKLASTFFLLSKSQKGRIPIQVNTRFLTVLVPGRLSYF